MSNEAAGLGGRMQTCGEELADGAVVPEQIAALMQHVASNMGAHAQWVGTATTAAQREHDALVRLGNDYRRIAVAARRAASTMRSLRTLEAAPHDPAAWDQAAFSRWMDEKVALQRSLARLLSEHADASESVLGGSQSNVNGPEGTAPSGPLTRA